MDFVLISTQFLDSIRMGGLFYVRLATNFKNCTICWNNWWNSDDASWNLKQNQHYLDLRHVLGTPTNSCKIVNLRRSTRFWRIRFWFVGSEKYRNLFILDGKILKSALIMCEMRRQGLKNLWHFSVPKCSLRYSIIINTTNHSLPHSREGSVEIHESSWIHLISLKSFFF